MNTIERIISRVLYGKPNFYLKKGDVVRSKYLSWDITIVDINWALRAAAVELSPGTIVVYPVAGLKKVTE